MSKSKELKPIEPILSLLEQARKLSIRQDEGIDDEYRAQAEVYIAWLMGEVDTSATAKVLGLSHQSAIASKAGTVLRNCLRAGAIKIEWTGK